LALKERAAGPLEVIEREWMVNGVRTFSRVIGEGHDVVLVHGAGVSTEYWRPAQQALAAKGLFRVHGLDLPGFGRSADPPWPPDLHRLSAHLGAWLEQAVPGACDLVGQSLGCEISVLLAAARPERIGKLVLAAPAGLPGLKSVWGQVLLALVDAPREPLSLYPAILPAYLRCGPRRFFRVLEDQRRCSVGELLPHLQQPVLVVRGVWDPVVTAQRQQAVVRALAHAQSVTIPGAHGAHFSQPEKFAEAVGRFLGSRDRERSFGLV
jgi:pimeloyl-ACP methyl ester carboxylesterase